MSVRKWGNVWWIDVAIHKGGKEYRTRKPAGARTRGEALKVEAVERARLETRAGGLPKKTPLFKEFSAEFLDSYAKANNKPSELAAKTMTLRRHLVPAFGEMPLDEITADHIEKYKARKLVPEDGTKPKQPKTVNNHLIVLAKIFAVAIEWRRIDRAPKGKLLKLGDPEFDFLDFAEAERLLASGNAEPWRTMILCGLRAGLRISEMIALRWDDVDVAGGKLVVRHNVWKGIEGTPKGWRSGEVSLKDELSEALRKLPSRFARGLVFCRPGGKRWTRDDCHRPLRRACRAAGIREVGWHVLRHTFASHLVMRGVPLKTVQELMRHASIASTMKYAHLSPVVKKEAVELLGTKRPEKGHGTVAAQ
jgi:integrase